MLSFLSFAFSIEQYLTEVRHYRVTTVKLRVLSWEVGFGNLLEVNGFNQATYVLAAAFLVFNFIHDGFHQAYAKTTFAFFVNNIIQSRFVELVDIEDRPIVDQLKN